MTEILNLSAICRCCHVNGSFRSLLDYYESDVKTESFADILSSTFGVYISPPTMDASYAICDTCIENLLHASQYKQRVLQCEVKFAEYCRNEQILLMKADASNCGDDRKEIDRNVYNDLYITIKREIKDEEVKHEESDSKGEKETTTDREFSDDDDQTDAVEDKADKKDSDDIDIKNASSSKTPKRVRKKSKRKKSEDEFERIDESLIINNFTEDSRSYSCKTCGDIYQEFNSIKRHLLTHPLKKFKCAQCMKEYTNKWCYEKHLGSHRNFETGQMICDQCGKKFPSKKDMISHLRSHINGRPNKCHMCPKEFKQKATLQRHIRMHNGIVNCGICEVCGRKFNNKTNMIIHKMTVHDNIKRFPCDECEKSFTYRKHLASHKDRHHSLVRKRYQCDICPKSYLDIKSFKVHKLKSHYPRTDVTGQLSRTYGCQICNVNFDDYQSKVMHMRLAHNDSYVAHDCTICGKSFSSKYILERHKTTHDPVKRYSCEKCDKKFSHASVVTRHIKVVHDRCKYNDPKKKCGLCKMSVRNMEKHQKSHNERNLVCQYCSKVYSEVSSLNRHVRSYHLGIRPFVCRVCDRKYLKRDTLKRHMLRKHNEILKTETNDEFAEQAENSSC